MDENNKTNLSEADLATEAAIKMLDAGLKARKKRFDEIKKNEDAYNGVTGAAIRGRNNVPFDCFVMGGFVDTLLANIDEPVSIKFGRKREQDKMSADKITAAYQIESAPDKGAWDEKVLDGKFLSTLSGRIFLKKYTDSTNGYHDYLDVCDHYDMVVENKSGNLDVAKYKFQMNIFRSRQDLLKGAMEGYYDSAQVKKVFVGYQDENTFKKVEEAYAEQQSRWANFGMDANNDYVGTKLYRFTEGVIYFNGKWKYIVFSKETKQWIRYKPLEEVFSWAKDIPGRGPWLSAATHPHPFMFWTKAPADDIRPVGYTMKKIVNTTLDSFEKNTYDQTAFDPKIFKNPSDLLWRQDGLVRANVPAGKSISDGIYKFTTRDNTSISINLIQWLDNFIGQKTGITPDAQGSSRQERVGILVSNLEQVSKRMMLTNKRFNALYVNLGVMFDYGLYDCLREPMAIKLIGNDGVNWDEEITREDTDREFTVSVISGLQEMEKNLLVNQKKGEGFKQISSDPILRTKINGDVYTREYLKYLGYTDEQVRVWMDVNNGGSDEVLARAAQLIQDCLEGKEYIQLYRGATFAFVEKIINFASEKFPIVPDEYIVTLPMSKQKKYYESMKKFDKLVAQAQAHMPIAEANAKRSFVNQMVVSRLAAEAAGGMGAPVNPQMPGQTVNQPTIQ